MQNNSNTFDAEIERKLSLVEKFRLRISARLIDKLLSYVPGDRSALVRLGNIYFLLGEFAEAIDAYKSAIDIDPGNGESIFRCGIAFERLGQYRESMECYKRAASMSPALQGAVVRRLQLNNKFDSTAEIYAAGPVQDPDACFNDGVRLFQLQRFVEALDRFDEVIRLQPDFAHAHANRGSALTMLGRMPEALESFDKALGIDPDFAEAFRNKGVLLNRMGNFGEALDALSRALALQENDPIVLSSRAYAYMSLARLDEARADLDYAIALDPQFIDANWNRAVCELMAGALDEGFQLYEWRIQKWGYDSHQKRGRPVWLGQEPIENKTLLITPEQGFGDFIQFCRYAPLIAKAGTHVIVEVPRPLWRLAQSLGSGVTVIECGEPLPDFDFVCSITSLPLACRTSLDSIPADTPYLRADPKASNAWSARLANAEGLRVGLAWSGGFRANQPELWSTNERRNIPLRLLEKLNLPGVIFYSLQKGDDAVEQLYMLERDGWSGPAVVDFTFDLNDFADTASLIDNLDLVITVDTAVAHLAGALGKPVWILNRSDTCWRWMLDRIDSPWYPSARLFRQPLAGDWESVVAEVRQDLAVLVAERRNTAGLEVSNAVRARAS